LVRADRRRLAFVATDSLCLMEFADPRFICGASVKVLIGVRTLLTVADQKLAS
jgi:hypothetical protein